MTTGKNKDRGEENRSRLKWWQDARLGMFIHYGLYSQLAEANGS